MFDWIRRKYVALCERIEAAADRHNAAADRYNAERLAIEAARRAGRSPITRIKAAYDRLLDRQVFKMEMQASALLEKADAAISANKTDEAAAIQAEIRVHHSLLMAEKERRSAIIEKAKAEQDELSKRLTELDKALDAESIKAARKEHRTFKEKTESMADRAYEKERKLAVARGSKLVGIADAVAGRKDLKAADDAIEKADRLLGDKGEK